MVLRALRYESVNHPCGLLCDYRSVILRFLPGALSFLPVALRLLPVALSPLPVTLRLLSADLSFLMVAFPFPAATLPLIPLDLWFLPVALRFLRVTLRFLPADPWVPERLFLRSVNNIFCAGAQCEIKTKTVWPGPPGPGLPTISKKITVEGDRATRRAA